MLMIGLLGFAGSGKDEACKIIQKHWPHAQRFAFADELKREVSDGYQIELHRIEADKEHYRPLLQLWGVGRREHNPNYWIEKVDAQIQAAQPNIAIITDVRFPNEVGYVRSHGGIVARVVRAHNGPANSHVSESATLPIVPDYVIRNDGTLEDFALHVQAFISTIPTLAIAR